MSAIYAAIPLFNIIFTYGMETTYFRFMQKKEHPEEVNNTLTISLLVSSFLLSILLWMNQSWLAKTASLTEFPLLVL